MHWVYEGGKEPGDTWLNRFLTMDRGMHQMVRSERTLDIHGVYGRYPKWLPYLRHSVCSFVDDGLLGSAHHHQVGFDYTSITQRFEQSNTIDRPVAPDRPTISCIQPPDRNTCP